LLPPLSPWLPQNRAPSLPSWYALFPNIPMHLGCAWSEGLSFLGLMVPWSTLVCVSEMHLPVWGQTHDAELSAGGEGGGWPHKSLRSQLVVSSPFPSSLAGFR
jgi:hypothetical protein